MSSQTARKPNANVANRRSLAPLSAPPRSPTPSKDSLGSNIPVASSPIGRRHTIREGLPGHVSQGSLSSLRTGISARSAVKRASISGAVHMDDNTAELLEKDGIISDLTQRIKRIEANAAAAADNFQDQKQALQSRMEEAVDEATKMEDIIHSRDETIEELESQIVELDRRNRDQEHIYETERITWSGEKEDFFYKEEELNATIQRLKETITELQKENSRLEKETSRDDSLRRRRRHSCMTNLPPVFSENEVQANYLKLDGESRDVEDEKVEFAPPSASATPPPPPPPSPPQQDQFNNLVMQKDKLIHSLRLELAEYEVRLTQADHMGGSRVSALEQQLMDAKMTNARLMEEIESYQLLISTATLNGDFSRTDIMTNAFSDYPQGEQEKETEHDGDRRRKDISRRNSVGPMSSSLADELEDVEEEDDSAEAEAQRKLEAEAKTLKDQNKALTLYINNIIERLLNHKDFEAILDKTPSLGSVQAGQKEAVSAPPPPPVSEKPSKFFSLARNVMKTPVAVNKPVPAIPAPEQEPSPLQRSQSMRVQPTGLRQQSKTDVTGTREAHFNLVNTNVPKAPQRASTFFNTGTPASDGYTTRPPRSRNSVASSASTTSSVSDHSTATDLSSPTTPHGPAPVAMGMIAGNKLRPLRLVQENATPEEEKKNKRSSWMGWFNRGKEEEPPASSIVFERRDVE
ncbi:hypothetical protein L211DRAFT_844568 [Terfezia boudieri ATCC MYA-4762]|uniref:M protein, serotype 2.1 n=1 Tax=Terfezia boudieri ATCC MYA-4762 TaxID=1051890 RepID=A0A3N4M366_9PEZI|nr:hypothetical protein L211DRAFT_844568 [Terfezia boudieri ATCC MYA-4762]